MELIERHAKTLPGGYGGERICLPVEGGHRHFVTGEGGDVDKEHITNWGCHERRSWGRALTSTDMVVVVVLVC